MQAETQHAVEAINAALGLLRTHIDVEASQARLAQLLEQIANLISGMIRKQPNL